MGSDTLRDYVLALADGDGKLTEAARLAVLAALEDPEFLGEALGAGPVAGRAAEQPEDTGDTASEPVGAYLESLTVQGFRGIGPEVTMRLQPGPGLIVIAGRNGCGKSTMAEAVELALTGVNSRWKDKNQVWSQTWRNLHAGEPARIRVGIAEEGAGKTTIGVDWPPGADIPVTNLKSWVQRAGQKQEPLAVLGWQRALEMYRPLLSYDELSGILEGKPSEFYDQLYRLLGLEQLTTAIAVLDAAVKRLRLPAGDAKMAAEAVKPVLEQHADPRAATALAQVKKAKPDLDVVRPLITDADLTTVPPAWQQARHLTTPASGTVALTCTALRSAAADEQAESRQADVLAADRATLLSAGLEFHEQHGEERCPVCGQGTLDEAWALAARAALEQEQSAARALNAARAQTAQARKAVLALVREVQRPPLADPDLTSLTIAREAYDAFVELPLDGDTALADHVEGRLPHLKECYQLLAAEALALIQAREDAWSPVAIQLAGWLEKAQAAALAAPQLAVAADALKWLQGNAGQLRNERIAPLANRARAIWAALRQESNVDLGAIRLEGQKTTRRVLLEATVDGSEAEAFGVMSQGELQALTLAIFIPRATAAESPFRFVMLDDPIQAMDPSKIDGLLEVLIELAHERQVIVFTHDDRLPAAIRRSRVNARIIEVVRGANSTVSVIESTRPATRLLDDAYALAADDAVPAKVKKAAIPVLCREALEATAWDVYSAKALADGQSRAEVEATWEKATKTARRLALALSGSADDDVAVDKWKTGGKARGNTLKVVNKGIHQGVHDFVSAVNDARLAVGDLGGKRI